MTTPAHTGRAHSTLGASIAHRWVNCPGSVALVASVPPLPSTAFADEGTAAHELAEQALRDGKDCLDYTGQFFGPAETEVTEDIAASTQVFVDAVRRRLADAGEGGILWLEKRFDLATLGPPAPMFGTGDAVVYDPIEETLYIIDLKFGRGVLVEVKGNMQLRYYALGATLAIQAERPDLRIRHIVSMIVQPRMQHPDGPVRSETIAYEDLVFDFAAELLAAADKTQDPNAPLVAGSHCKFCPAGGVCPAQQRAAEEAAAIAFADLPVDEPPRPSILPDAVFYDMLDKLPILETWIKAMHAERDARVYRGEVVPGWKVVDKRPTRKWSDPDKVLGVLKQRSFEDEEIFAPRTLKSVAQLEKVVGKAEMQDLLGELISKESSGTVVVRETDPRPAKAVSAGDAFLAIPANDATP